jgi:hypothetical protein
MAKTFRFALGFGLGLILSVCALMLAGVGHGTYAPMIANASLLAFIPLLGLVVPPFLWGIYFLVIPEIDSLPGRIIALALILLLHIVPGIWLASQDHAFTRALESQLLAVLAHGITLVAAVVCLAVFISSESRRRKEM